MVVHFVNSLGEAHNAHEELFFDLSTDQVLEEYPEEATAGSEVLRHRKAAGLKPLVMGLCLKKNLRLGYSVTQAFYDRTPMKASHPK